MTERIKLDRRPTRQEVQISQERIDAILKDISEGSTRFHASEANDISYTTFYYWIKQGQLDMKYGIDSLNHYLVKALRNIEQKEIKKCKKNIAGSSKGHKGSEWTLERAYWKHFSSHAPLIELAEDFELEKGESADEEGINGRKNKKGIERSGNEKGQETADEKGSKEKDASER